MDEVQKIVERYNRRNISIPNDRYNILNPWTYMNEQEKERAIIRLFKKVGFNSFEGKRLLEVGCGTGFALLWFMRLGFSPDLIVGNELLPERARKANEITPSNLNILHGNALDINFEENSFDIIYQSMVFSSILDDKFAKALAQRMWSLLKKGGGVLWYDFTYNNPFNKDVRGVPYKTIKNLFPESSITRFRISLAPPLARSLTKINDKLYIIFNAFSFLRTHLLCWIAKN